MKAGHHCRAECVQPGEEALDASLHMSAKAKQAGNDFFKAQEFAQALACYQRALLLIQPGIEEGERQTGSVDASTARAWGVGRFRSAAKVS